MRELLKEHGVLTPPSAIFNEQIEAFVYLIQQVVCCHLVCRNNGFPCTFSPKTQF